MKLLFDAHNDARLYNFYNNQSSFVSIGYYYQYYSVKNNSLYVALFDDNNDVIFSSINLKLVANKEIPINKSIKCDKKDKMLKSIFIETSQLHNDHFDDESFEVVSIKFIFDKSWLLNNMSIQG